IRAGGRTTPRGARRVVRAHEKGCASTEDPSVSSNSAKFYWLWTSAFGGGTPARTPALRPLLPVEVLFDIQVPDVDDDRAAVGAGVGVRGVEQLGGEAGHLF